MAPCALTTSMQSFLEPGRPERTQTSELKCVNFIGLYKQDVRGFAFLVGHIDRRNMLEVTRKPFEYSNPLCFLPITINRSFYTYPYANRYLCLLILYVILNLI